MKLQNLISKLEKHHKKKIDLTLNRTFNLLELDWKKFIEIDESLYRPFEIINSVGNPKKAKLILNWEAKLPINKIIEKLICSEVNRVKVLNKEEKFKIENFF